MLDFVTQWVLKTSDILEQMRLHDNTVCKLEQSSTTCAPWTTYRTSLRSVSRRCTWLPRATGTSSSSTAQSDCHSWFWKTLTVAYCTLAVSACLLISLRNTAYRLHGYSSIWENFKIGNERTSYYQGIRSTRELLTNNTGVVQMVVSMRLTIVWSFQDRVMIFFFKGLVQFFWCYICFILQEE